MARYQIPLSDYNRIHQVAVGVLADLASVERSCVFFSCFGAMVLNKHYQIKARPVAGAFALCVSDRPDALVFADRTTSQISSSTEGFHMWVQTETHIIDFMAPIYGDAFAEALPGKEIPRKMLQKRIAEEVGSINDLATPGQLITYPNLDLTEKLIDNLVDRPIGTDLLTIADKWFGNRRKRLPSNFQTMDGRGEIQNLSLPKDVARSAW